MQDPYLASKLKIQKNITKSILQIIQSYYVQETALKKKTKYSRIETILKIGHQAKAIAHKKNPHFRSKIKIPKNMPNPFYKPFRVICAKN